MGIISTDQNLLTKLKGFWSGKDIYINLTDKIIVLKPDMSLEEVICMITDYVDANIERWIRPLIENMVKSPTNCKGRKPDYGLSFVFTSKNNPLIEDPEWYSPNTHSLVPTRVIEHYQAKRWGNDKIVEKLTKIWLSEYRANPSMGFNDHTPSEALWAMVNWKELPHKDFFDFLVDTWMVANIDTTPARFGLNTLAQTKSGAAIIREKLPATEKAMFSRFFPTRFEQVRSSYVYKHLCRLTRIGRELIMFLVMKDLCLLPYEGYLPHAKNMDQIGMGEFIFGRPLLSDAFTKYTTPNVTRLAAASTMRSIDDFPSEFVKHIPLSKHTGYATTYKKVLKLHAIENNCREYPYADLIKTNNVEYNAYHPGWIAAQGYSKDWVDFVNMYWQLNKSGDERKASVVRHWLRWAAGIRRIASPLDVKPEHLRNPFMDSEEITYFEYLRDLEIIEEKRSVTWSGVAWIYKVVANASKLPGSPFYGKEVYNPFEGLENPFVKEGSGSFKTERPRMPDTLVEMMVEILLEPDENGVPTYKWVQEATRVFDTVHVPSPDDPTKTISVWCPSTANCLATTLLTPIRGHQSRWLDQGLMDEYIFDLHSGQMTKNDHPLAQWRYANGKNHREQYGRFSGVLQAEYDFEADTYETIIWVSTNKTRMWDPDKQRGYPLPWPTGEELIKSDDEAVRAAGRWINRAYQVLKFQLEWMQRYDPNPQPVGLEHSLYDRKRTNTNPEYLKQYPWFTPLFRNLSDPAKGERDGHQVNIYLPVSKSKIEALFGLVAAETEKRLKEKYGRDICLTRVASKRRLCLYKVHDLRVRGISHLLELGVPLKVIQHLVGHSAVAMTFGYAKYRTPWIKEQLIKAAKNRKLDVGEFDRAWSLLKDGKISPTDILVFPKNNGDTQVGKMSEDITAYVPVAGGVCRMGGPGSGSCQVGRLYTRYVELGVSAGEEVEEYGSSNGFCALCRFWATGPLFLQEQEYVGNLGSFKLLNLARRRKKLYAKRNDLLIAIDESDAGDKKYQLERELLELDDQISNASNEIATLQLDFGIRADVFLESEKRLTKLREILNNNSAADINRYELITGPIGDNFDFKPEIMETCELGLVRSLAERFRFLERKMIAMSEDVAMRAAEFTDQFLEIIEFHGGHMFQIRDVENRTAASSMLLNFFSYAADPVAGDSILQDIIDGNADLGMIDAKKEQLQRLATLVVGTVKVGGEIDWETMARNGDDLLKLSDKPYRPKTIRLCHH